RMSTDIRLCSLTTTPSVRSSATQRRRAYLDIRLLSFIEICAGARVSRLNRPIPASASKGCRYRAVAVFTLADYVGAAVLENARISLLLSSLTGYRCACPGES